MTRPEVVIVGAGLAGLSLAVHLVRGGFDGRLRLVDAKERFEDDRTWCSWEVGPSIFPRAVTGRWTRWRVGHRGRNAIAESRRHPYLHVPSSAFYREALAELDGALGVSLELGTRMRTVVGRGTGVRVETDRGALEASHVFDSRPPAPPDTGLVQQFVGQRVRVDGHRFDPSTVTLMDFRPSPGPEIRFLYVLPFSRHEALVEATWITPEAAAWEELETDLAEARAGLEAGGAAEVLRSERGVLPMVPAGSLPAKSGPAVPIGIRGGMIRPSSGYAFEGIQRQTRRLARQLTDGEPVVPEPTWRARTRFLDRIFLAHLKRRPEAAPELFLRMTRRVDGDRLARFMMDRGSLADDLSVVLAMPYGPFVATALGTLAARGSAR